MESLCLLIQTEPDIADACRQTRYYAERVGLKRTAVYQCATATSELANNLIMHAEGGWIYLIILKNPAGLAILAEDQGPGIFDIKCALRDGFSTSGSLGYGLPGVQRLMDEFKITSQPGAGTQVWTVKWR